MDNGILTRYSASAGSGKTFRLTVSYLSRIFLKKENYRSILAVTFTNKATAEMKGRILDQLHILASGGKSGYLDSLLELTGKNEDEIRNLAGELLFTILHDFSSFSVCTIDAFFQKIIRAFARESGLYSGFSVELDNSRILSAAVDEMIASSADNLELKVWLNDYVNTKLGEEKSWNPKSDIIALAEEIFRERFKILSGAERERLEDKKFLTGYIEKLRSVREEFERTLFLSGEKSAALFQEYGLSDDMFYQKGKGIPAFVRALASGKMTEPKTFVRAVLADPPKWSTKTMAPELQNAIAAGLGTLITGAIIFYDSNIARYNSAREILSNIYVVGILSDILNKVRVIASAENSFLLSDAGELLRDITSGDQAPFIYEKIGNRFGNYMIDEFQDTSMMQWNNFLPLIEESMARGYDNLVVGDIKQSIYRFRNSDWQILGKLLDRQIPGERLVNIPLTGNWRSRQNIIRFNNTVFKIIPENIDRHFAGDPDPVKFSRIYTEAVQVDPGKKSGGYVRLEFIEDDHEVLVNEKGKETRKKIKSWQDKVLGKLPEVIESIQDRGYSASDIGIIVRYGREGTDVLNTMIRYRNNCPAEKKEKYNYRIVSDYSLTLANSPVIIFIISALRALDNPADDVSRAAMLRFYLFSMGSPEAEKVSLNPDSLRADCPEYYPEGYAEFMERTASLTVFEAVENIISFFGIGKYSWNAAYLNTFQDLVISFSGTRESDFSSFLDWWDSTGNKTSVVLPADQDAARIFTIHKAKGLEFKVVILPFLSWNDDHDTHHREIVWVKPPDVEPFNELGIVPILYRRNPPVSIFSDYFRQEKYSAYLDNLNLLYVALTRAKDAIFGYAADDPDENSGISGLLKEAVIHKENPAGEPGINPSEYYDRELRIFDFGEMPFHEKSSAGRTDMISSEYSVSLKPESLKLKLHGENYFISGREDVINRINYGRLIHQAFEYIDTPSDVPLAVTRLVLEGLMSESDSESMTHRLEGLISSPEVQEWFKPGNRVMKEAGILLPEGDVRRPDRVILRDGRAVVIDFKSGEQSRQHSTQVLQYCSLLKEMGYPDAVGFLWYIDRNKIIKV